MLNQARTVVIMSADGLRVGCVADDQGERSVSHPVLRVGHLLWFVLPRQRHSRHCRHGIRRLPEAGST